MNAQTRIHRGGFKNSIDKVVGIYGKGTDFFADIAKFSVYNRKIT